MLTAAIFSSATINQLRDSAQSDQRYLAEKKQK